MADRCLTRTINSLPQFDRAFAGPRKQASTIVFVAIKWIGPPSLAGRGSRAHEVSILRVRQSTCLDYRGSNAIKEHCCRPASRMASPQNRWSSLTAPIRAAQYVRMSTDHQQCSPIFQRQAIAGYAAAHNIRIVRDYEDAHIRGRKADDGAYNIARVSLS
ncbi:recombinase family protein [Paraburkholderia domus]|uniref:recombinase family protein n=1 Tax=Paraburkholderia domus TaxID=2793075 RepID=UPI002E2AC92B|nr:recombinase family protein [Paraburkholderia domus]